MSATSNGCRLRRDWPGRQRGPTIIGSESRVKPRATLPGFPPLPVRAAVATRLGQPTPSTRMSISRGSGSSGAGTNAKPSGLLDSRTSPMAFRLVEPRDCRASKPRRSPIRGRNCASSGPERALLALSDACESHRCVVPGPISRGFPGPETRRGGPTPGADCVFVGGRRSRRTFARVGQDEGGYPARIARA